MVKVGNITYFFSYNNLVVYIENYLNDYYGMDNFSIVKSEEGFIISFHNAYYLLFLISSIDNINLYYDFSYKIHYSYSFIPNKYGKYLNTIDGESYVLLKTHSYSIAYYDIINPYIMEVIISINWREKWIKKSEMLQSMYYENRGKYSIIDESIPYYSSLLDYAIYLLNDFSSYKGYGFIQHLFLDNNSFCNPFYFIIDIKERDIASYWKYLFYHNDYYGDYLWKSFCSQSFNYSLVLARLLYPDWYLLELEKILYYQKSVDDLKKIVSKTSSYTNMIHEFSSFCGIKKVSL